MRTLHKIIPVLIALAVFLNFEARGESVDNAKGMVVSASPLASKVGIEILRQGGNAVDAAVGVMFALSIVEPWASGMGGGGFMLIQMSSQDQPVVIDYREQVPLKAKPELFYRTDESFQYYAYSGFRSICVPGMIAGAEMAIRKYGTLNLSKILTPVIELARKGFPVSAQFSKTVVKYYDLLEMNRTTSLIYLPDWYPLQQGTILKREDLAITLEMLTIKGLRDFYQGQMAQDVAEEIDRNNGMLTLADLNSYQPIERRPIAGRYRGYDIWTVPAPGTGGAALIELLHILEDFDLPKLGFNSGDCIHLFIESLKIVLKDRENYSGDPQFRILSQEPFVLKNHASAMRTKIDINKAHPVNLPESLESGNATHVSIIDPQGNTVSLTQTNNFYFGSGVSHPKYGVLFNNGLYNFSRDSLHMNAIAPNKRSASSMAPTIVLKNGRPFLILGSSGASRTISTLALIISSVIDFNMDIQQALDAPRFHYEDDKIQLETRIESEAIDRLKALGHQVNLKTDFHPYFGIVHGILIDPISGASYGGADLRGEGKAEAF